MPTVPRYGQPRVAPAPLPSPSGGGGSASPSAAALGAGYQQARARRFELLSDLGGQVAHAGLGMLRDIHAEQQQARQQADQYAVLKGVNQLQLGENEILYNEKDGVYAQRGDAANPLPELVQRKYDTLAGEIAKGLGTDEQRLAFDQIQMQRWAQLHRTVLAHVSGEQRTALANELSAYVENNTSHALQHADDVRVVAGDLERTVAAIRINARSLGLGDDQTEREVTKATTGIHAGVIGTLIDRQQIGAAQAYYEETKDQIDGAAIGRIEKALGEGTVAKQAMLHADAAEASGLSLADQIALIKDQVTDPAVRREALAQVEHTHAVKEKIAADQDEAQLKGVYDLIERTGDFNSIPAAVRATLSGSERSALRYYLDHLAKGEEVEVDLERYYGLMQMARDHEQGFARLNLWKYRAELGKTEFKQLADLQFSLRKGDKTKVDADLGGFRTHSQIVNDTLELYGINADAKPGTPEAKAIATLRRMLDLRVAAAQQPDAQGKRTKVTNEEIQQTLDTLLGQQVKVPGSWWNLWPGGKSVSDTTKRLIDLTITDVPALTRGAIAARLKARGLDSSDENVLAIYKESQVK